MTVPTLQLTQRNPVAQAAKMRPNLASPNANARMHCQTKQKGDADGKADPFKGNLDLEQLLADAHTAVNKDAK